MSMKLSRIIIYLFLVVMAISAGTFLYWSYSDGRVIRVNNGPVPVHPPAQNPDQLIFLTVNYCKLRSGTGTVRRTLVSSTVRIMLPLQTDSGPKGCQQVDVPLLIPKGVVPDTYYVHIDVDYQLNPLRKVTDSFDSQKFTVQ